MKKNRAAWQHIPTGLASVIALAILVTDNSQPYIVLAFLLVVVEFTLGYLKTKVNKKFEAEAVHREKNC